MGNKFTRSNLFGAIISGTTTFLAGIIPIATYLALPIYYNIAVSPIEVSFISGVFLVRCRSRKTIVHWKVTLAETIAIVIIATIVSLLLGVI